MGWFWADPQPKPTPAAPNPLAASDASPPPGCPMHVSNAPPASSASKAQCPVTTSQSACPVKSPNSPFYVPPSRSSSEPVAASSESQPQQKSSTLSKLNPLNYMFSSISQERAPNQTVDLPVEREVSSIPRGDDGLWEYPSPQQMYNAMLRKGYTDTPQDAVESMVAVHNFLNEGAWSEIVEWERIFSKGLKHGWEKCRRGSANLEMDSIREQLQQQKDDEDTTPRLIRFQGRPQELTPKARILQALGWVYPEKFGTEPPFDRHDWYVQRQTPWGPKQVRYVIDYYSGPPEPTGEPVFYLDIRPAIDTPTAAIERLMKWGGDVWWRASGGVAREQQN
ncbi:hypothetical protein DTO195F2_9216 [Paecilomyces variotii]|nr:hypothetical protein DTO195F2_9216 [Paecilomyces variotii]